MKELWRVIPNYEPYESSNLGNIRVSENYKYKIINPFDSNKGYLRCKLPIFGINFKRLVHRLVGFTWIENLDPKNKTQINHKDGKKYNNVYTNLEWCTGKENVNHAFDTGLRTDNIKISMLDIITKKKYDFRSLNEAGIYLKIAVDTLVTYIPRSIKYPIFDRYVFIIDNDMIDRMLNTTRSQSKKVYVYNYITNEYSNYTSMAHASIYTGMNTYSIREALNKKKKYNYYIGGYVFSYAKDFTYDIIDKKTAQYDRDRIWSKPVVRIGNEIEVYNYDTKEVKVFPGRDEASIFIGCKSDQITNALIRSKKIKQTGIIYGYGVKMSKDTREWYPYTLGSILNSKSGLRITTNVFEISNENGEKRYVHLKELSEILKYSIGIIKNALKIGQVKINELVIRSGKNVTVTIVK